MGFGTGEEAGDLLVSAPWATSNPLDSAFPSGDNQQPTCHGAREIIQAAVFVPAIIQSLPHSLAQLLVPGQELKTEEHEEGPEHSSYRAFHPNPAQGYTGPGPAATRGSPGAGNGGGLPRGPAKSRLGRGYPP